MSHSHRSGKLINFLIAFFLLNSCISLSQASDGQKAVSGRILPSYAYLERGDKATFVCQVEGFDDSESPSSRLSFFNQTSQKTIDAKFIRILNRTAIELSLPTVPEQATVIYCQYESPTGMKGVTTAELYVGRKPDKIEKLDCFSYHWISLNCSFVMPENHVRVSYELRYSAGDLKSLQANRLLYDCEAGQPENNVWSCRFIDLKYRRSSPLFTFNLTAKNFLGETTSFYEFDNFAHIIVDVPSEWKHEEPTDKSIRMKWELPKGKLRALDHKPFDFEISVTPHCYIEKNESRVIALSNVSADVAKNFSHVIDLEYAFTWYDIKIRSKISMAEDIEKMWSPWSETLQVKSKPRLPDFPPIITKGAFHILPNDDVYVYWKEVPKCKYNGDNFTYSVVAANTPHGHPKELKETYAVYRKNRNMAVNGGSIKIRSQNAVGLSEHASTYDIPSIERRIKGPKDLQKRLKNGTYELKWSPPDDVLDIVSYTVFWCTSKTEGENKCNDKSFNFETISAVDNPSYYFKSEDTVNFAISVNTHDSTSGMTWTTCTTGNSNEIGKIKLIWIPRLSSTEINIMWKLECTDKGIVTGYVIEYCPAKASAKTDICLEEPKNFTIHEKLEHTEFTLTDLAPYKTYGIFIRMASNGTLGPPSDPLVNTTFAAAPSPIRELLLRKVENTSVDLNWQPPEHFNGVLVEYKIFVDEERKLDVQAANPTEKITYHWTGLEPFKDFEVTVSACTSPNLCSNGTKSNFKTEMGAPGPIESQPIIDSPPQPLFTKNNVSTILRWNLPKYKGGFLDFYELKIVFIPNDGSEPTESIYKFKSRECILTTCTKNQSGSYTFNVRGVNLWLSPHQSDEIKEVNVHEMIRGSDTQNVFCDRVDAVLEESLKSIIKYDNHSQFFTGPWSPQNSHTCSFGNTESQNILSYMFITIVSIVFVATIFYLYKKIRDIKNIIVEFPPGLEELSGGEKGKKGKANQLDKPDLLHNVDNNSIINEDENKRLLRRSINGSLNGADCSSIHSDNTRSENEMGDEIEYNDFGLKHYELSDNDNIDGRLQSFLLNPTTGEEVKPILVPHEPMPTSTPRDSPKPHIIMNPTDSSTPSSSGYITAPSPPNIQLNGNGYVTPAMFTPIQTQNNNGYTQLNRFGKPILNNDRQAVDKIKTPMVATTDQKGISGYVTHKQLADFGHRMQ